MYKGVFQRPSPVPRKTSLRDEHLLNANGDLEIHKVFNCKLKTPKERVVAVAVHPTAKNAADLLQLKRDQLRERLRGLQADAKEVDQRANPPMRKAIWQTVAELGLDVRDVPLDEEDGKKIWDKLKQSLPIFALFRADRRSLDEDDEVQDPMKVAVAEAIKSVADELEKVKARVQQYATQLAEATLNKMREIDPKTGQRTHARVQDRAEVGRRVQANSRGR